MLTPKIPHPSANFLSSIFVGCFCCGFCFCPNFPPPLPRALPCSFYIFGRRTSVSTSLVVWCPPGNLFCFLIVLVLSVLVFFASVQTFHHPFPAHSHVFSIVSVGGREGGSRLSLVVWGLRKSTSKSTCKQAKDLRRKAFRHSS